jgi:hypothetical protein
MPAAQIAPDGAGNEEQHDVVETVTVEQDGKQLEVPVPHVFQFSWHEGKVVMHYKILSTDMHWLPALKDGDGNVIWHTSSDGTVYWEPDKAGIPLVVDWPVGVPQWANISEHWKVSADLQMPGNVLKPIADAARICSQEAVEFGWKPEDKQWYDDWVAKMATLTSFEAAVSKPPYHSLYDSGRSIEQLMLPWVLPSALPTQAMQQVVVPQQVASNTRTEPITHTLHGGGTYTAAKRAHASAAASGTQVDGVACPLCNSAADSSQQVMLLCPYGHAHEPDKMGYHVACLQIEMPADSDNWMCPKCVEVMESDGQWQIAALLNRQDRRPFPHFDHKDSCPNDGTDGFLKGCSKKHCKRKCPHYVAYLVQWVGVDKSTGQPWPNNWEPASNIGDSAAIKRFKAAHKQACSNCKMYVCTCTSSGGGN